MRTKGMMIGLLLLLVGVTSCETDLSEKPRAVTKDHRTAICHRLDVKRVRDPSTRKDTGMVVMSQAMGHLVKLPPGEEVIVLNQQGEFMQLRFMNKPKYPDVWVHMDAVEMRE